MLSVLKPYFHKIVKTGLSQESLIFHVCKFSLVSILLRVEPLIAPGLYTRGLFNL